MQRMINGKTQKIGIIGFPVEHSFSPILHNSVFNALNLNYTYIPLPVSSSKIKEAVQGLVALDFAGANVTIPHKVSIMEYLDEIHETARKIGAVNTIVIKAGKTIGYNTDGDGFLISLQNNNIILSNDYQAVLLGCGGAARSIACSLIDVGIKRITIAARNKQKASSLIESLPQKIELRALDWSSKGFEEVLVDCNLLVNCTPIGMSGHPQESLPVCWECLHPSCVVCDLIYNPPITNFLSTAQKRQHKIINGEGMLVEQAALAFGYWTGVNPDRHLFFNELKKITTTF